MVCPKCGSKRVNVNLNSFTQSQSRSLIWNLLMIFFTGGFWILWMLVRGQKQKQVNQKIAVCQKCGHTFKV